MLTKAEIERLLIKEDEILADEDMLCVAEGWDLKEANLSSKFVSIVYSYMKNNYKHPETLGDLERTLGLGHDAISRALRLLEEHGYLAISRASKPYQYRVIK